MKKPFFVSLALWGWPCLAHPGCNAVLAVGWTIDMYVLLGIYLYMSVLFMGSTRLLRHSQMHKPGQVGKWFLILSGTKVFLSVVFLAMVLRVTPMDARVLVLHFMLPYLYFQHLQLFVLLKRQKPKS